MREPTGEGVKTFLPDGVPGAMTSRRRGGGGCGCLVQNSRAPQKSRVAATADTGTASVSGALLTRVGGTLRQGFESVFELWLLLSGRNGGGEGGGGRKRGTVFLRLKGCGFEAAGCLEQCGAVGVAVGYLAAELGSCEWVVDFSTVYLQSLQ